MLKEITLKEAVHLMEKNKVVYAVNLNKEERALVDLTELFADLRILADLPADGTTGQSRGRRSKQDLTEKEIEEVLATIDRGKIGALQKAGWSSVQIADEFGYTPKSMEKILAMIEQR